MACITTAVADYDRDGRSDVLLMRLNGSPPQLLHNDTITSNHWISMHLLGKKGRDPIGARVEVHAGARVLKRQMLSQASKGSQSDRHLLFGLGSNSQIDVAVFWPDGQIDRMNGLASDRHITIEEGKGLVSPTPVGCATSGPLAEPRNIMSLLGFVIGGWMLRRRGPDRFPSKRWR